MTNPVDPAEDRIHAFKMLNLAMAMGGLVLFILGVVKQYWASPNFMGSDFNPWTAMASGLFFMAWSQIGGKRK